MPALKRQFFRHERGIGDEDWYYLARNPDTGDVFVLHEWSHRSRDGFEPGSVHYELATFLTRRGAAQDRLRELIRTLVSEQPTQPSLTNC